MGKNEFASCGWCKNTINKTKQKYVLLGTYTGKKVNEEVYYHFTCFKEWHETKTRQKAENIVKNVKNKAMSMVKSTIQNIQNQQYGKQKTN